jgi:hypothetical protein
MKKINIEKLSKLHGGTTQQMCLGVGLIGPLFYAFGGIGAQSVVGNLASYCWNS